MLHFYWILLICSKFLSLIECIHAILMPINNIMIHFGINFWKLPENRMSHTNEEKQLFSITKLQKWWSMIENSTKPDPRHLQLLRDVAALDDIKPKKRTLGWLSHYTKWIKNFILQKLWGPAGGDSQNSHCFFGSHKFAAIFWGLPILYCPLNEKHTVLKNIKSY